MNKIFYVMMVFASILSALPAAAFDISWSAFGTLGYAVSDRSFNYLRFVDNKGTFYRDSVLGAQVDVTLNNEFSMTVQGKVAPAMDSDNSIEPFLTWAFLSWRPSNDWLIRAGRVRIPLYLKSQTVDVGETYDFARLPSEVYMTSLTNDGDGIIVSKTWNTEDNEFILEGFFGTAETDYQYYLRDGVPALGLMPGAYFGTTRYVGGGLALTLHRGDDTYRMGAFRANIEATDGTSAASTYPFVLLGPGVGYYQTTNLLPGPGVPSPSRAHAFVYTLGADVGVGYDFRLMGEYVYRTMTNSDTGPSSQAAYLALLRPIEKFTPYLSCAWIQPLHKTEKLYNNVNNTVVPNIVPGSSTINAAQRAGADGIFAYDQITLALGASYQLTTGSKLKAEWARTQTFDMSAFVDAPLGGQSGQKVINVFSLSYSFVF